MKMTLNSFFAAELYSNMLAADINLKFDHYKGWLAWQQKPLQEPRFLTEEEGKLMNTAFLWKDLGPSARYWLSLASGERQLTQRDVNLFKSFNGDSAGEPPSAFHELMDSLGITNEN